MHAVSLRVPPAGADVCAGHDRMLGNKDTLTVEKCPAAASRHPLAIRERIIDDGGHGGVAEFHSHAERGKRQPTAKRNGAVDGVQIDLVVGGAHLVVTFLAEERHERVVLPHSIQHQAIDGRIAFGKRGRVFLLSAGHAQAEVLLHDLSGLGGQLRHEGNVGVQGLFFQDNLQWGLWQIAKLQQLVLYHKYCKMSTIQIETKERRLWRRSFVPTNILR